MKIKVLLFVCSLFVPCGLVHAQKMLGVRHNDALHLVKGVTPEAYLIDFDGAAHELPRANTPAFLPGVSEFLPGFIQVEDESGVEWDADDQNNTRNGLYYFRYSAKITSNRDLKDAFLAFEWVRPDKSAYLEVYPLGNLEADIEEVIAISFWVPDRFRLIEPEVHVMSMGFEVGSSRDITKPMTPYAYALENSGAAGLPDGNVKPLQMPPLPEVTDDAGNPREGSVKLYMRIDEMGYVSEVEVREYSDWVFAKATLMSAPFYLFQPRVKNGKPVAAKLIVPFKF